MYISQRLREQNIAEWIIYMWQVEDLLRGFGLDLDRVDGEYVSRFGLGEEQRQQMCIWYSDLIEMMQSEGVEEEGHLQITLAPLALLTDLHQRLLDSDKVPFYRAAYYKALPFIVEVRAKGGDTSKPEIESALEALYGVMLLKMQKKEISTATATAMADISKLIAMLADYYNKEKEEELEL